MMLSFKTDRVRLAKDLGSLEQPGALTHFRIGMSHDLIRPTSIEILRVEKYLPFLYIILTFLYGHLARG
jgi:hypothetical protein